MADLTKQHEDLRDKALEYIRLYQGDMDTLQKHRIDALNAYRREPYPEDKFIPEGSRSKFVMSDVADTIEWIIPSLMRIFYGGNEVVKIEGRGPEDVLGAELLNEKVNWDFQRRNKGFLIFYDWFKASMMDKFSVVKYWWQKEDVYKTLEFEDVSDEAFTTLTQDKDFIIDEHEETVIQEEMAMPGPPGMPPMVQPRQALHKVKGRRIADRIRSGRCQVVPPEEFVGSIKATDFKEEEFVAHKKRVHKLDLMREYNLKEDDLSGDSLWYSYQDSEHFERFKDLGGVAFFQDQENKDFYYIYECFMKEEVKKRRDPIKLCLLGMKVISKEDNTYGHAPFCVNSPIRMPHRAIGLSIAELVMDLQKLRSALARYLLNNIYYQTENMIGVNPWKINVADFLTNRRPGGVITTKYDTDPKEALFPLPPQPLAGHAYQLLDSVDSWREKRTGVTSYNQGTDANTLNKTAQGISQILSASQQRIELIARIFAETGVSDLLEAFAQMNVDFLDMPQNIRINQEWMLIDPTQISVKFDTTVDVALGTGARETKVQQMTGMLDRSMNPMLLQLGVVTPENLYQQLKTLYVEMGYKNHEKFVTQPPPPMMMGAPNGPEGIAGPPQAGAGADFAVFGGGPPPAGQSAAA